MYFSSFRIEYEIRVGHQFLFSSIKLKTFHLKSYHILLIKQKALPANSLPILFSNHQEYFDSIMCDMFITAWFPLSFPNLIYSKPLDSMISLIVQSPSSTTDALLLLASEIARNSHFVFPVFRNIDESTDPLNYWPVSLLPFLGNVLKVLINSELITHLTT